MLPVHLDLFLTSCFKFVPRVRLPTWLSVKNPPTNAGDTGDIRDMGLTPGSGRSPGVGNGNPPQYSCLENSMETGAWWAAAYEATRSWTRRSD